MNRREQSISRRVEDVKIVYDCLKNSGFKYFKCKKITRLTGLPTGRVRIGLKMLHEEDLIEKINRNNWRKNNGI